MTSTFNIDYNLYSSDVCFLSENSRSVERQFECAKTPPAILVGLEFRYPRATFALLHIDQSAIPLTNSKRGGLSGCRPARSCILDLGGSSFLACLLRHQARSRRQLHARNLRSPQLPPNHVALHPRLQSPLACARQTVQQYLHTTRTPAIAVPNYPSRRFLLLPLFHPAFNITINLVAAKPSTSSSLS